MLIRSPPCVAFIQLQTMIPDGEGKACQLKEGMQHMEFMVRLYKKQLEGWQDLSARKPGSCETTPPPVH